MRYLSSTAAHTHPDLDAGASGSTEPITIGAEAQGVDDVPTIKCIKMLPFIEVPQHGLAILGESKVESGQCDLFQMLTPAVSRLSYLPHTRTLNFPKTERLK